MLPKAKRISTIGLAVLVMILFLLWEHFADGSGNAPSPSSIKLEDSQILSYFSPYGGCTDAIVNNIYNARKTIDVAIYTFTSRPISQAIVKAYKRGIDVRVIMDKHQASERFSKKRYLSNKGIPIELYTGDGIMHNKFAVIDSSIVITGSFNWTSSAERYNYENLVVIYSSELAQRYETEFDKMWKKFK